MMGFVVGFLLVGIAGAVLLSIGFALLRWLRGLVVGMIREGVHGKRED